MKFNISLLKLGFNKLISFIISYPVLPTYSSIPTFETSSSEISSYLIWCILNVANAPVKELNDGTILTKDATNKVNNGIISFSGLPKKINKNVTTNKPVTAKSSKNILGILIINEV